MHESLPNLVTPLSSDQYYAQRQFRVHESEFTPTTDYRLMARLDFSHFGESGEFQARIEALERIRTDFAAFVLSVIDTETGNPLISLTTASHGGILTPERRRISHYRHGHIATISEGYLLNPDSDTSRIQANEPGTLVRKAERNLSSL